MDIRRNVSLKDFSTMRLGGQAAYMVEVSDADEVVEAVNWAEERQLPVIMIGGGSNIVWKDEGFPGLVIVNRIMGYDEQQEDDENYYLTVGAGEDWDSVVQRTAAKGLTGIEALRLIPGTAGATPIQNVGAYGQEVAQTLVTIKAYDRQAKQFVTLHKDECAFGYRTSRFKTTDRGRFFITHLTFHLRHANPRPPYYHAVQDYLESKQISERTPVAIAEAVRAIREAKLPDPAVVANNGSFFANPIISTEQLQKLQTATEGAIPSWPAGEGKVKVPAAWLVEHAGFKDAHDAETGMATWHAQALVLVNEHAQTAAQLLAFRQKIIDAVRSQYGITLEQEPELLPL